MDPPAPDHERRDLVAVTGAAGFVGRSVVANLARSGWTVRAVARSGVQIQGAHEIMSVGDLLSADLERTVEGCQAIVNCAARVHVLGKEDPSSAEEAYDRMNRRLPVDLANAAKDAGVRKFVQLSSVAAITAPEAGATSGSGRQDSHVPATAYGRSKLNADRELEALSDPGFEVVSLRPPAVFGPGVGAFTGRLLRAARIGVPLPLGRIGNSRSFIYVENLAAAVDAALAQGVSGTYVVTDSPPVSTGHLYRTLLRLHGWKDRVWSWPEPAVEALAQFALGERAGSLLGDAAFDGSRFREVTGWRPQISFDEAWARTVAEGRRK